MIPLISWDTAQYIANEALVLPVDAQAAFVAPIVRACVNAADMPLSLKLPEGFIPSYCRKSWPSRRSTNCATRSACCRSVWPSPTVTTCFCRSERQQFVKPPYTAETKRRMPAAPFLFEISQRFGRLGSIPVVGHIQQFAAIGARDQRLIDAERRAAGW